MTTTEEGLTTPVPAFRGRPGVWLWAGVAVFALLLGVLYASTFRVLARAWTHNDNYSHGMLIPLVSAFLLWRQRHALRAVPREGSALGLPVIAFGLMLLFVGLRSDLMMIQGHSFVIVLAGLTLHFFGRRVTRIAAFPLAYLVFMSPVPPVIVDELSFRLKQLAIASSLRAAGGMGIPVVREGTTLHLPTGSVSIEDPCSGLRSLIAVVALAVLLAYFGRGGLFRRAALVMSAVPVTMLSNWARITLVVLVSNYVSVEIGTGVIHDISGYVIFGVDMLGLLGAKALLRC